MGSNDDSTITAEVYNRLDDLFGDEEDRPEEDEQPAEEMSAEVDSRLNDLFGDDDRSTEEPDSVVSDEGEESAEKGDESAKEVDMDEFPSEQDIMPETENDRAAIDVEYSAIRELKSVVLSLEWEITDQVMQKLSEEIARLEKLSRDDKIVVAFLQLMDSLGQYIRKKRANAHPDSISLLHSVYDNLEKVYISEGLTDVIKKKMLIAEVNKYKQLKEQIKTSAKKRAAGKASARTKKAEPEEKPVAARESGGAIMPPFSLAGQEEEAEDEDDEGVKDEGGEVIYGGGLTEHDHSAEDVSSQRMIQLLEDINKTLKSELQALRAEFKKWREQQQ